jgi:hypothetical protein
MGHPLPQVLQRRSEKARRLELFEFSLSNRLSSSIIHAIIEA